jgi:hypothetical protein
MHKQGKLQYWPAAWCPSFKYHGIPALAHQLLEGPLSFHRRAHRDLSW